MNLTHPRFPVPVHRFRSSPMSNSQYDPSSGHSSWHTDVPSSSNAPMTDYTLPSSQYSWNGQETSVWSSSYNNFDSHSEHNHAPSDASFSSGPTQPSPSRSQQPHHVSHSHSHSHSQSPPVQQQHAHQSKSFSSTLFPTGTFSYNSLASSSTTNGPSSCIVDERPKFAPVSWEEHDLYRIGGDLDQDPHSPPPPSNPQPRHVNSSAAVDPCSPSSSPRSPPPSIVKKEEEPDDGFVFELSSNSTQQTFAPMTEVPLRATHASKSQRKLMTSFRLDPFATQNGIRANTDNKNWLGEDIGPHTEEPQLIEFQIELTVPLISPSLTNSPLPSFEDPADFFSSAPRASGSSTSRPMLPIPANSPLTQYLRGVGQPSNQLSSATSSHQIFPPTPPQVHPPTHTSIHTSNSHSLLYPYQDHDLDDDDHWMGNDAAPFQYSPTSTHSSRAMDMSSQGTGPGTGTASPGAALDAVMTPAQSLQWQMGFQAGDPNCLEYPNGVTTSKPARVNISSRYHTYPSQSQIKRHTIPGGSSAYNTPVVDVDMVFPDSRSSAHALGSSHQTRSSQRLAVLNSTSTSSAAQDMDLQYTVSSSSIHWNKNHASSASSVSSLTDDDEPFNFPREESSWSSHQHVSSGTNSIPSTRHVVTSSSDLPTRRLTGVQGQRQTHTGTRIPCFA